MALRLNGFSNGSPASARSFQHRLQIGERSKRRANYAPPWVIVDSVGGDHLFAEYFLHHFRLLITKF